MNQWALTSVQQAYPVYRELSIYNGFRLPDPQKIIDLIAYFQYYMKPLNEKKLYSLMWLADLLHFKGHQCSITGLAYEYTLKGIFPAAIETLLPPDFGFFAEFNLHHAKFTIHELASLDQIALRYEGEDEKKLYASVGDQVYQCRAEQGKYLSYGTSFADIK